MGTGELPSSFINSTPEIVGEFMPPTGGFDHLSAQLDQIGVTSDEGAHRRVGRVNRMLVGVAAASMGILGAVGASANHGEPVEAADAPDVIKTTQGHLNPGDVLKVTVLEAIGGKAVAGNLTSDRTDESGFVTAYPCGAERPGWSDLNPVAGQVRTNRLITYANQNGEICFYTLKGTDLVVDVDSVVDVTPIQPVRVDTRVTGNFLDPGEVLEVFVPEAVGGKTVVGNVTSDNTAANGFITGYPCDKPRPVASDLNPRRNEVVTNRYIGQASQEGKICFYTLNGTNLIVDVNGISNGSSPIPNQRIDTRITGERLSPGEILRVNVFDAIGSGTVYGNLTSDRTTENGYITAWNCDAGRPEKSDLNPIAGRVTSNRLIVTAGGTGDVCFYSLKETDLIADFNGLWIGADPLRNHFRFDTRTPYDPRAGEGIELVAAAGANFVSDEDVAVARCVYLYNSLGRVWQRWLDLRILNQQPNGAAVILGYTDYDVPEGDIDRTVSYSSTLADAQGVIEGWSIQHFDRSIPNQAQAQHFVGNLAFRLFENTATGRQEVGQSSMEINIGCQPYES